MSEVEELESRIRNLSRQELATLRDWFLEFDSQAWDQQITSDFKAEKFKALIDEAHAELAQGKAREL